ncbi:MAG: putative porin, partial [Bacteroidota bacterium]|nr:putative porin [Bacteroidota bacterium]
MNNRIFTYIYILIFTLLSNTIIAQNIMDSIVTSDTTKAVHLSDTNNNITNQITPDSMQVYYFTLQNDWLYPIPKKILDTTLNEFHYTNPIYKENNIYSSLGNTGLSSYNLFFSPNTGTGMDYGIHTFDRYLLNEKTLNFYDTDKPYSEIYYVSAPDKEQILNFHLNQRVYKSLTIGTDIKIINSVGAYYRQKARDARVSFKAHYISDNKRYKAIAYYAHSKLDWMENGGIKSDSIFENNVETDRLIYPIKLEEANNLIIDAEVFLRHSYELSATKAAADSISKEKKNLFNFGKLQHEFKYHRQSLKYTETIKDSTFYQNYYNEFEDRFNT